MKEKIFIFLKKIYNHIPINYKAKKKLKGVFYRIFGFMFKNTTSYRVWKSVNSNKIIRGDEAIIDEDRLSEFSFEKKIAIQLHLFYEDLLEEFVKYFNNMPYKFDLLVSIVNEASKESIRHSLENIENAENIYVEVVKNRGRDVSPLICTFGKKISEYDYICHVHSKKSLFTGKEQTNWREYLLKGLLGSREKIKRHFFIMETGEKVGLLYPETYDEISYLAHTWLKNKGSSEQLLRMINIDEISSEIYIDYPMGTMFWAKTDALKQFFNAEIRAEDFPKEEGQKDGTIAHAFERCLGTVCKYNDYNIIIYDEKSNRYLYNFGRKNLNQYFAKSYEQMKLEINQYDIVSFDIFDTLISRKISNPYAILDFVEKKADRIYNIESGFCKKRPAAENMYRNRYPDKDCDIDDIYEIMLRQHDFDSKMLEKIKSIEVGTEISLVSPKKEMVEILKYAKHKLGKKIYIISDMQLRLKDIKCILELCGIGECDYDRLWLSSDMNIRKDNGTMWKRFAEENEGKSCIHIGDNEVSDVQVPQDYNVADYHVMSGKALYQLSDIGRHIGMVQDDRAETSAALGLILNKSFSEPFRFNGDSLKLKMTDAAETGYCLLGPAILSYMLWMIDEALKINARKILFCAREGYLLNKIYSDIKKIWKSIDGKELPEAEYLYVSRRALSLAALEADMIIDKPLDIFYEGKLKNLLEERYGLNPDNIQDEDIKLPDNKSRVIKVLEPYREQLILKSRRERENYIKYFLKATEGISDNDNVILADIGYSGTIQYYLSLLTGRCFAGRYFATDEKRKPMAIEGNTIKGCFADNDSEQELSKSKLHRYHLVLESILIAPDGQLVNIDDNGRPVFAEEINSLYNDIIKNIHEGIRSFTVDYLNIMKGAESTLTPDKEWAEKLFATMIETDILSDDIKNSLAVDDKYCSGEIRNAVDFYKYRR